MKSCFVGILVILIFSCFYSTAQELYLPNGTSGIGTSSNSNIGFGKSAPTTYLDALKSTNLWLMRLTNSYNNSYMNFCYGATGNGLYINAGTNQTSSSYGLRIQNPTRANTMFQVMGNGTVGINTSTNYPNSVLTITGGWENWITFKNLTLNTSAIWAFHNGAEQNSFQLSHTNSGGVTTFALMFFNDNCQLGIGTSCIPTDGKMAVAGKLYATEIEVSVASGWCDYVFDDEYKPMPLMELQKFITDHNHLPEVPTTSEIMEDGLNLGEMDALLLKKIEEMTLYIIDLQNQINELKINMQK